MTDIKQAYVQTSEELLAIADQLRQMADLIESGEVTAVAYVSLEKGDSYRTDFVRTNKVSVLELLGATKMLETVLEYNLRTP